MQIALIIKAMAKFQSKYQFQIPLLFYTTVEKFEICDGNGQMLWLEPPKFGPILRGSGTDPMLITVIWPQGHQKPGFEPRPFRSWM